jgi:hypothetical protein
MTAKAPAAPRPQPRAAEPSTTSAADLASRPPISVPSSVAPPPPPIPYGPEVKTIVHQAPAPSVIRSAPGIPTPTQPIAEEDEEPIAQEMTASQFAIATAPPPPPPPAPREGQKLNPAVRVKQVLVVPEGGSAGYVDEADLGELNEDGLYPGQEVPYDKQQEIIRNQKADQAEKATKTKEESKQEMAEARSHHKKEEE